MAPRVNPYIAGNPVGGSPAFIGRETILRSVLRMLESPSENAIVLYGQRRIGKTSVLQELARRLPVDGPYHPVYFDLQDKAALPLAQVLTELAQQLAAQLQLSPPDIWQADAAQEFQSAFIPTILDQLPPDHSLVLLFDEFDVLDSPAENQAGAAFFPYLRELLAISPRLQFVFVIGRRPEDLSSLTLSVFKSVRTERISQLDAAETERLVRLSETDGSLSWSSEAVQQVRELTGGHPFLTQQLCQEVWERANQDTPKGQAAVTADDMEQAVPDTLRGATSAMEWLWNGLGPAERIVASALASAGPRAITQDELEIRLQESGVRILVGELRDAPRTLQDWDLIEPDGDGYRFRVELLRRWIAERKPLARVQEEIDHILPAAESLYQAAYSFYQDGQLDESVPLLRQVVRLNPNHQRGNLLLAEIMLARNQLAEARQLLENLFRYSPAAARPRLVQTLLLQAQYNMPDDGQLELYARVLEMEPRQTEAQAGRRRIWEQRGDRALEAGDTEQALAAYRESGETKKIFDTSLKRLSDLQRAEKYAEALELARQLGEENPRQSQQLPDLDVLQRKTHLPDIYSQAVAALKAGRQDEAVQLFREIISVEPRFAETTRYLHLAITGEDIATLQAQLQQESKARREAERLIEEESQRRLLLEKGLVASRMRSETERAPASLRAPKLSPWKPLDHLRLLYWLFFAPDWLKAYEDKWGEKSLQRVGNWPAAILTLLPLFIPCLALGLGTLPRQEDAPSTAVYLWLSAALAIATLLTGWAAGGRDKYWATAVAFGTSGVAGGAAGAVAGGVTGVVACVVAGVVAFGMAVSVAVGVAVSVAVGVAVSVAVGVAGVVAFGVASIVAFFPAINVAIFVSAGVGSAGSYVASLVAGLVALYVASGAPGGVSSVLEKDTRSWLRISVLLVLVLAYACLIWFSFLGGWKLFA